MLQMLIILSTSP